MYIAALQNDLVGELNRIVADAHLHNSPTPSIENSVEYAIVRC